MSPDDLDAIKLTAQLAGLTTLILLVLGAPLAFWLSRGRGWTRRFCGAVVTLPLVLPPTVLGFYLLVIMGPNGPLGRLCESLGLGLWPFSFKGLVLASVIYSLPFVIQPLQNAFAALGRQPMEAAATLGAGPVDAFFTVMLPQIKTALVTAAIMGFAHTVGEFGVVLMIGGNIPGRTRVISTQIYGHVEAMEYGQAHLLAGGLLVFSLVVLLALQCLAPAGQGPDPGPRDRRAGPTASAG